MKSNHRSVLRIYVATCSFLAASLVINPVFSAPARGDAPLGAPSLCVERSVAIDDFETGPLPSGVDFFGNRIGFFTFAGPGSQVVVTLSTEGINGVLRMQSTVNDFGGVLHLFENESADTWVTQDWSSYEALSFQVSGTNSGAPFFLDVKENRKPGSTVDDAEVWTYNFTDDFSGWKRFEVPFSSLVRKEIGNGAPNDGLTLTEIHGWALGSLAFSGVILFDDLQVCGEAAPVPLTVSFEERSWSVDEGETAVLTVTLNRPATEPVAVRYATAESTALPDRQYTAVSGTLNFAIDDLTKTIEIPTFVSGKHTGDRAVAVNLYEESVSLGFQRKSVLTIVDRDSPDPRLVDDFEGFHPFINVAGEVTLNTQTIMKNEGIAVPGQGAFEDVLQADFDSTVSPVSFDRRFSRGQDWSGGVGLSLWHYGSNSGETFTLKISDNMSATTGAVDPSAWVMVWSDEFNEAAGTPPNPNLWRHDLGDGVLNGNLGWGNSESQYYTNDSGNAAMDGTGNLVIRLQDVDTGTTDLVCWYGPCAYTSARLNTQDRLDFEYGRIEARIRVPDGPAGLWPAFWMLGTNVNEVSWPQSGEIDIMEYVSRIPNEIFGTVHGPGYSGGASYGGIFDFAQPVSNDYHTIAVEWQPDSIDWYVDGILFHQASPDDVAPNEWVFNHPFFMILNSAIGGNFGGAIDDAMTFPQETLVDYVRVYQAADSAERFEATYVDDFSGWKQIILPFEAFSRSAAQPGNAPDDGLTLTEIWGYSLVMPEDTQESFFLDRVYNWPGQTVYEDGFESGNGK